MNSKILNTKEIVNVDQLDFGEETEEISTDSSQTSLFKSTDTVEKVIDVSSKCLELGKFVFKDVAEALGSIIGVGGLVKAIMKFLPDEPNPIFQKLETLEGKIEKIQESGLRNSESGPQKSGPRNPESGPRNPESGPWNPEPGNPESRIRNPKSGIWNPESGPRNPDPGIRTQESGIRTQKSGIRNPDPDIWNLDLESGPRNPESRIRTHKSGIWTWNRTQESGIWNLESGPRNSESGFRNPGSGSRNPGSGSRNQESGSRNPESVIRNPESGPENPESQNSYRNPDSEIRNPDPRNPDRGIRNLDPGIRNPDPGIRNSGIRNPEFVIQNPESGTQNPDPGIRTQESGPKNPESGPRNPESGIQTQISGIWTWNPDPEIRNPESGHINPESGPGTGPRNPESGTWNPDRGIRNPDSGIRDPDPGIRDPDPGIRNPDPGIRNPASGIQKSGIWTQESEIRTQKSGIRNPEPRNPESRNPNLESGSRNPDPLSDKMNAKFDDMKAFIAELNFYVEIMSPASNLMKLMRDCMKHPAEEGVKNFLEEYFRHPPLILAYSVLSLLEQKSTNPLKLAMDSDPLKTTITFNKWSDIINGVLGEFLFLEAFGSGLLEKNSTYNAERIVEKSNELFAKIEEWKNEYMRENSYWNHLPTYLEQILKDGKGVPNEKLADQLAEKLETILTNDAFYLGVFNHWKDERDRYYHYTYNIFHKDRLIEIFGPHGTNIFLYKSIHSNSDENQNWLKTLTEQAEAVEFDVKEFRKSYKGYAAKLAFQIKSAEFVCFIGELEEEIRGVNCQKNGGKPGWDGMKLTKKDANERRSIRWLIAGYP
ncbi:unnamed protein product [Caenorhabditis nigoni]